MAYSRTIPIGPYFNLYATLEKLARIYRSKGFDVIVTSNGSSASVKFSKGNHGIKKFAGLAREIIANFICTDNALMVNFTDPELVGKATGFAVGLFAFGITGFTSAYGSVKQASLPKEIADSIQGLVTLAKMGLDKKI